MSAVRSEHSFRIGISGSYGGLNLGDEAILKSMIRQFSTSLPTEITVFSRNVEDTRRRHPQATRVVPARDLIRNDILPEIEPLDLFVLGGGGILYDADARIYMREVELAREHDVPVMIYAIGAGPLRTVEAQALVRKNLATADIVTVREAGVRKLLEEIGVKREIEVTADPALLLEPEPLPAGALKREGLESARRLVGMSVREPGVAAPDIDQNNYHALLANAADFIVDRLDADVVLVPMEPTKLDMRHSHAVIAQMLRPQRATVLKGEYTSGQLLSLVGQFDFAVGMRLHFLIFAALQGVPFVALPYASKVHGFLADMELVAPPFDLVNSGRLISHIDQNWDDRGTLKKKIRRKLPALQKRAARTNEIAVQLLRAGRERMRAPTDTLVT